MYSIGAAPRANAATFVVAMHGEHVVALDEILVGRILDLIDGLDGRHEGRSVCSFPVVNLP